MGNYGANDNPPLNKFRTVAFNYRFAPQVNLKIDQHSTDGPEKCFHIVRRIGSTNLLFLVIPKEIPG